MSFLSHLFGARSERRRLQPLYDAIIAAGRDPLWYVQGQVPDTLDGRFDMVAAILSLVLLRLEREGERARRDEVLLTEIFIEDMDGTLRQIGIGDFVVGKHVGKMMGALGGRLSAFRSAFEGGGSVETAVTRNIFRDSPPSQAAVETVSSGLRRLQDGLAAMTLEQVTAGRLPTS